jgi:hypothetical protein
MCKEIGVFFTCHAGGGLGGKSVWPHPVLRLKKKIV